MLIRRSSSGGHLRESRFFAVLMEARTSFVGRPANAARLVAHTARTTRSVPMTRDVFAKSLVSHALIACIKKGGINGL